MAVLGACLFLGSVGAGHAATSPLFGVGITTVDGRDYGVGTPFTDVATGVTGKLTGLKFRAGFWIDAIQVITASGPLPLRGKANGGDEVTVSWPDNEYLVEVSGTYGQFFGGTVGQVAFKTNTGRVLGPYGKGFGDGAGKTFSFSVPDGNQIVGFTGRTYVNDVHPMLAAKAAVATLGVVYESLSGRSGLYGSTLGTWFGDTSTKALKSIRLRAGIHLHAIQGVPSSGTAPRYGSTVDGAPITVSWPAEEYLVAVYGKHGNQIGAPGCLVGQISFMTNKGRILGPYGSAQGRGAGRDFYFAVPLGNAITGFAGRTNNVSSDWTTSQNEAYIAALGVTYGPGERANLIVNGAFEDEWLTTAYTKQYADRVYGDFTVLNGWTPIGDTMEVGLSYFYGVGGTSYSGATVTSDGRQVAELDARGVSDGGNTIDGFYQDVQTQSEKSYTLSFDVARRAGTTKETNRIEVYWRGALLATIEPTADVLAKRSYRVEGSGGLDRLMFKEGLKSSFENDGKGGIIDNVSLIALP